MVGGPKEPAFVELSQVGPLFEPEAKDVAAMASFKNEIFYLAAVPKVLPFATDPGE